jgi:hypothetical protein
MKIEDIIFLGAGASASEGAPLQGDLFREYFQFWQTGVNHRINAEMNQRLVEFFAKFFGIDIKSGDLNDVYFPTFEEILGILELALNRGESFKDYSLSPDKPRIQRIREDLIFLIAIILDKKLRREGVHHKKLLNRLKNEETLPKTGFVSLNYDILIDNAIAGLHPTYHLDYGVEFTNYYKEGDWHRPDAEKALYLYKLHGSLNWLYCPTCTSLTLTPKEKRVAGICQ